MARLLAESVGGTAIEEDISGCPFLEDFYRDPVRFATQTEFAFLLLHYHQLFKEVITAKSISDFALAKDVVFARCNLEGLFLPSFEQLYDLLATRVSVPEICFHLRVEPELALSRVHARGRDVEASMTLPYLVRLSSFYDEHLRSLLPNVVVLNVDAEDSPEVILERLTPHLPEGITI